ncbi:MAG: hypothetical protein RR764_07440 [Oscillospiraceae bacterium]
MFENILNIISSVMACLGCILVLTATISLARRRFYEPLQDRKMWIIALCMFACAIFLFSPTKSTSRTVKASIASVEMATRRTAYAKNAKINCVVQNASGDTIAEADYLYAMESGTHSCRITVKSGEEVFRGAKNLSLLNGGFTDDGFTKSVESRKDKIDTYHFYKNFKQIISKKREILKNYALNLDAETPITSTDKALTEAELANIKAQNDKLISLYRRKLTLYQWEEVYHVDSNGYLVGWEIFCEVKNPDHKRETQRWIYTVNEIVKSR